MHPPLPGLPHPQPGQRPADREQAERLIAAVDEALATPTRYHDPTPVPEFGTAPPVAQPGRPPMSPRAADTSGMLIAAGFFSLCLGGAVSLVLYASGYADPVVIGLVAGAPAALALAVGRLLRGARPEPEVHHHYDGPTVIDQRQTHSKTTGVWARTNHQGREE